MKTSVVSHNLHNRRALAPACHAQPFPPLPGQFPGTPASLPAFCLSTARLLPISEHLFLNRRSFLQLSAWQVQSSPPRFQLFPDLPVSHPSHRDSYTHQPPHNVYLFASYDLYWGQVPESSRVSCANVAPNIFVEEEWICRRGMD